MVVACEAPGQWRRCCGRLVREQANGRCWRQRSFEPPKPKGCSPWVGEDKIKGAILGRRAKAWPAVTMASSRLYAGTLSPVQTAKQLEEGRAVCPPWSRAKAGFKRRKRFDNEPCVPCMRLVAPTGARIPRAANSVAFAPANRHK